MTVKCATITDSESGATARILVGFGFNCFEFTVPGPNGPEDVLWSVDHFDSGRERASSSGIPILFPFPGRLRGTIFSWRGQDYEIQAADGRSNAIHGFVLNRPWRVVDGAANQVTGQFHAHQDAPELRKQWPADFRLTVRYEIIGTTLHSTLTVENPDDRPLPCGLGTHPYFRLPLGGQSAADCLVQLPVTERWELKDMLPTGERAAVPNAHDLNRGVRFEELQFDDVFTGLNFQNERCLTTIEDPHSKRKLTQSFDRTFRECVVYTPPHREAICIEPYTCVPSPAWLADRGIDAGLRIVAPGESFSAKVDISIGQ